MAECYVRGPIGGRQWGLYVLFTNLLTVSQCLLEGRTCALCFQMSRPVLKLKSAIFAC